MDLRPNHKITLWPRRVALNSVFLTLPNAEVTSVQHHARALNVSGSYMLAQEGETQMGALLQSPNQYAAGQMSWTDHREERKLLQSLESAGPGESFEGNS